MQSVLGIRDNMKDWRKSYVIGKANEDVYRKLILYPFQGVNPYENFILLYGNHNVGKTHLANIWRDKYGAQLVRSYTEIKDEARYLLCEDIDKMNGKDLFHIFNMVHVRHVKCLMTTSVFPYISDIKDIQSRIRSIKSLELGHMSMDMIQRIFIGLLKSYNVVYTLSALKRISNKLPNDIIKMQNIVKKINNIALRDKTIFNVCMCHSEEILELL